MSRKNIRGVRGLKRFFLRLRIGRAEAAPTHAGGDADDRSLSPERLTHEKPALAILEVIMPKMSGSAAQLAQRFSTVRVLFTSGCSAESEIVPEGTTGRYLQKPYSPTTLARLVREMLDDK